ncbi:MAG: 3-deoxy-8-phosphooctulonate synthase, partial [Mesorhizobium sp.]
MSEPLAPNAAVSVGKVVFANNAPLSLIAGPCQLESRQHAFDMAGALKELTTRLGIGLVYK